jgi:hypothetical protein
MAQRPVGKGRGLCDVRTRNSRTTHSSMGASALLWGIALYRRFVFRIPARVQNPPHADAPLEPAIHFGTCEGE